MFQCLKTNLLAIDLLEDSNHPWIMLTRFRKSIKFKLNHSLQLQVTNFDLTNRSNGQATILYTIKQLYSMWIEEKTAYHDNVFFVRIVLFERTISRKSLVEPVVGSLSARDTSIQKATSIRNYKGHAKMEVTINSQFKYIWEQV